MNIRKIVVVGGMAAGAAFALAPLASADDLSSVVAGEVASMNFLFDIDTTLAGVPSTEITEGVPPTGFDTINLADVAKVQGTDSTPNTVTPFDSLVYGLDPIKAGLASDPGAYTVFNGAMVPFDDGINSLLYAMAHNGAGLTWDSGDLFGGSSAIGIAADNAGNGWAEAAAYFNFAWGDLMGFFGIFPPA